LITVKDDSCNVILDRKNVNKNLERVCERLWKARAMIQLVALIQGKKMNYNLRNLSWRLKGISISQDRWL